MKVVWLFIAVICVAAATIALWRQRVDVAFVIATVGVLAWFLRYRSDLKESLLEDGSSDADDPAIESPDEDS
jgi:hypothetical protein